MERKPADEVFCIIQKLHQSLQSSAEISEHRHIQSETMEIIRKASFRKAWLENLNQQPNKHTRSRKIADEWCAVHAMQGCRHSVPD